MQPRVQHQMLVIISRAHCHVFTLKNCLQSISPGYSSPQSFFHDLLVSNNLRAFDDSSMSRPHPVHLARVEQTCNALEEASTDPLQLLLKMWQCGETLEQCFRDWCDIRRRLQLKPERVDLDYPLIIYWRKQSENMQEQTERMRLEIMRESHAELEDVCFTRSRWWVPGFSSASTITRQWVDTSRACTCKASSHTSCRPR